MNEMTMKKKVQQILMERLSDPIMSDLVDDEGILTEEGAARLSEEIVLALGMVEIATAS